MISANRLMAILYWDSTIKNGNTLIKLAKLAPAPKVTKRAGRAQQISVEVEANREKKLVLFACSWLSCILSPDNLDSRSI